MSPIDWSRTRRVLAAHRHTRSDRVFCDAEGWPFTQGVMASQLDRMCRLAKLRPIGWHVLRHSFASHLVMRGVAIRTVQELMGHASIVITQRYAHLMPHIARDAVKLLDAPVKPPRCARRSAVRCGRANGVPKRASGSRSRLISLAPCRGARPEAQRG